MDWTVIGQYGIAGLALGILLFVLKMHYESYQANTLAITELKLVIERQIDRERSYHEVLLPLIQDTNERIREIQIEVRK
jgi:hypothetical protein